MRHFGRFLDKDFIQTENYHKMDNKFYNAAKDEQDKNNYKAAYKLYQKGVKSGDIRCNYGIAVFLTCGYLGEKDIDKANEIFAEVFSGIKVLAEQNDPISCCIIGFYYFNGYYVEEDKVEAVKWWKKSAEEKYAVAQYHLGKCYYNGAGVEEDKTEAVKWYRKAAEQGYIIAQYYLACSYNRFDATMEEKVEIVKWYRKAAEQGHILAQYFLALCYDIGKGVPENKAEAVKWYRKAAEQGYATAQYALGNSYFNEEGVEENTAEAVKWYRKAAEQSNASAQYALGNCYFNGEGVEENKAEAVKWYRKAAEQGNASAQYALGNCYYNGEGIEKNRDEAVKRYKKAAGQGHKKAQNILVNLLQKEKDFNGAKYWSSQQIIQGYAWAQYNLLPFFESIEADMTAAANWFLKQAELGDSQSQNNLGYCYHHGEGVSKNVKEAVRWYRKAAEQGNCLAQKNLGDCYIKGEGVEKNYLLAQQLYERSINGGVNNAKYELAKIYKKYCKDSKNGKKAETLFNEILQDPSLFYLHSDVYLELAKIYDDNQPFCNGVYKDNFKAKEYYEKALEYGEDCKSDLKTLEALMNIDDSEANRMGEFVKEISRKNIPLASLYSVVENRLRQEFGEVWERLRKNIARVLDNGMYFVRFTNFYGRRKL